MGYILGIKSGNGAARKGTKMITWTTAKGSTVEVNGTDGNGIVVTVNGSTINEHLQFAIHPIVGLCLRVIGGSTVIPVPSSDEREVRGLIASSAPQSIKDLVASSDRHDAIERMRTRGFA